MRLTTGVDIISPREVRSRRRGYHRCCNTLESSFERLSFLAPAALSYSNEVEPWTEQEGAKGAEKTGVSVVDMGMVASNITVGMLTKCIPDTTYGRGMRRTVIQPCVMPKKDNKQTDVPVVAAAERSSTHRSLAWQRPGVAPALAWSELRPA